MELPLCVIFGIYGAIYTHRSRQSCEIPKEIDGRTPGLSPGGFPLKMRRFRPVATPRQHRAQMLSRSLPLFVRAGLFPLQDALLARASSPRSGACSLAATGVDRAVVRLGWLRITPAARGASPIWEWIIEECAPGNVDPVSRDRRPPIGSPPAIKMVRSRMRRVPTTAPTTGRRMPVRAIAIPHLYHTRRWTRYRLSYGRSRRSRTRRQRGA
jgi:hypothetical protein